jgi:hypothetical protein
MSNINFRKKLSKINYTISIVRGKKRRVIERRIFSNLLCEICEKHRCESDEMRSQIYVFVSILNFYFKNQHIKYYFSKALFAA